VDAVSLKKNATKALARLPQDADIKTANLQFTSHWALNGQTLSVHREFTSNIAQPLCSGDVRKETAAALARIRDDYTIPISLTAKTGFAPTTVSFSPSNKTVSPASADSAGEAPTTQSGLATSENAPHIDSLSLSEQRNANGLFVAQEFVFHSPKGNAATLHFDVVSISAPAPDIRLTDGTIVNAKDQQQRGAIHVARFNCGPFRTPYSVVKRATLIDADGEKSNSVDFTVHCNPGSAPVQP